MGNQMTPTANWQSLVGYHANDVANVIHRQRPDLKVVITPAWSFVTMEYQSNRVRLWVDDNNIVVRPPIIG